MGAWDRKLHGEKKLWRRHKSSRVSHVFELRHQVGISHRPWGFSGMEINVGKGREAKAWTLGTFSGWEHPDKLYYSRRHLWSREYVSTMRAHTTRQQRPGWAPGTHPQNAPRSRKRPGGECYPGSQESLCKRIKLSTGSMPQVVKSRAWKWVAGKERDGELPLTSWCPQPATQPQPAPAGVQGVDPSAVRLRRARWGVPAPVSWVMSPAPLAFSKPP